MSVGKCEYCDQVYGSQSCTKKFIKYTPTGALKKVLCGEDHVRTMTQVLPRIRVGAFNDFFTASQYKEMGRETCPDCGAAIGGYHHSGCDNERCPRCGLQFIGCDCYENYDIEMLDGFIDEELDNVNSSDINSIDSVTFYRLAEWRWS